MRVLADGCFDPIHEGHVAYLYAARELGTTLIVNITNDDETWRKRPGIGPFLPQQSREAIIRALKPVDDVTVLDTSDALRKVRPDIYVKGNDWRGRLPDEEQEICRSLGIRICFLDTVKNSSTALLATFIERLESQKGWARS